jgi:uncharacterized protein YacL
LREKLSRWLGRGVGPAPAGQLLIWVLRGCFGAIIIGLAMLGWQKFSNDGADTTAGYIAFASVLGIGVLLVATDLLVRNKQITTLSALYFGLLLGLLLGNILSTALEPFLFEWDVATDAPAGTKADGTPKPGTPAAVNAWTGKTQREPAAVQPRTARPAVGQKRAVVTLLITVVCCYICISTLMQTKDEFRFIIPYVEFSKQVKGNRPMVLDTSVIIDGRIADICDTRFIDNKLIVPRFVLQELQSVADSSDKLKRNRGRRGLDMLKRMQNNAKVELQIHEGNLPELRNVHKVDERLVVLAKALGARVVTNDYNLNKIAQIQGVDVINLNELANSLKSVALPGEVMTVRLVKPGDQVGQGVGYLEDGTMVVVEQGRSHLNSEVTITVTSVLQTPAGRMIFGRLESRAPVSSG